MGSFFRLRRLIAAIKMMVQKPLVTPEMARAITRPPPGNRDLRGYRNPCRSGAGRGRDLARSEVGGGKSRAGRTADGGADRFWRDAGRGPDSVSVAGGDQRISPSRAGAGRAGGGCAIGD